MRRGGRIALALWVALHLLLAQQLALAHMIGHVGESLHEHSASVLAAADGDEEHGAGHSLSHVCILCVGGLGFHAVPVTANHGVPKAVSAAKGFAIAVSPAPTFNSPLPFQSRAPPSFHS